ncbi:MAG: pilus assembly protein [Lachnospiraceae bacterium]|nr:pilus assembly protein [Lachnospiraceae bacterium]
MNKKADCKKIYKTARYEQPEGSVTLEAAVVIPVILAVIIFIASLGIHSAKIAKKYSETAEIGRKTAVAAYLTGEPASKKIIIPGAETYNIDFFKLNLHKTTLYSIEAKPFTGVSLKDIAGNGEDEERDVFLAENATVFHVDRECTHLRLSIKQVDFAAVPGLRNFDGGKYKPCEICVRNNISDAVYITNEGDRYHSVITCSGLKRTVRSVKESEAVGMGLGPCSRCGK